MEGNCSRSKDCNSSLQPGCSGCSFQHFDEIAIANPNDNAIQILANDFFDICKNNRKSQGGRTALDKPLKNLFLKYIPGIEPLKNYKIKTNLQEKPVRVKYDVAFSFREEYFFYEVKGYSDNTNDILSAIAAAQFLKLNLENIKSHYYYIGISKFKRAHFLDPKLTSIYPYVKWAEDNNFLKFYSIVDIEDLLNEVKRIGDYSEIETNENKIE